MAETTFASIYDVHRNLIASKPQARYKNRAGGGVNLPENADIETVTTILRHSTQKIAIAIASLALLVGASWASVQESSPYLTDSLPEADRITAYIDGAGIPGLAITTQTSYLLGCYDLMRSATLKAESPQRNEALTKTCQSTAEQLANQTQTNPLAWFVAAFAAAKAGDLDAMSSALRNSYLTGPNEQWIALLRIPLAEANRARLDADLQAFGDTDLGNVAKTGAGVAGIVNHYSSDPAFRERLTSIVEKSSPADQRRFLGFLRSALKPAADQQP
jgi:hypothetical protein